MASLAPQHRRAGRHRLRRPSRRRTRSRPRAIASSVPTRRRDTAKHLILLPTVDVVEGDIIDPRDARAPVRGARLRVINLVGVLNERGASTFERAHVELRATWSTACKAAGVQRLVQMSALNAEPRRCQSRTCAPRARRGDRRSSALAWTIFRPSVIFGREDRFLNLFARLRGCCRCWRSAAPDAQFQPVYVGDVAHCIVHSLDDDATIGQRYDLCGPKVLHAARARSLRRRGERTSRVRSSRLGAAASRAAGVRARASCPAR